MKGERERWKKKESDRARRPRGGGRAREAAYGEGVGERGEGSRARKERRGGGRLGRNRGRVVVDRAAHGLRSEYSSRRCYARGYTYIYGRRWCMVCRDGSNSGIPGLKLASQWGSVGKLAVPRLKGFVVAAPLLSRDTGPTFRRVNGRNMIIRETFALFI